MCIDMMPDNYNATVLDVQQIKRSGMYVLVNLYPDTHINTTWKTFQ